MRFYTSDLHLGHTNIIKYCDRPYWSVPEMNDDIVARWNAVVTPDDEVVVIGDLAMGRIEESLATASRLAGRKMLVPGNHDRCWSGSHGKSRDAARAMYEAAGFEILDEHFRTRLGTARRADLVDVCHFPFEGDSQQVDRFLPHRPNDTGQWLVHGHVHDLWRQRGRMLNVGIDAWGGHPVSEDTLADLRSHGPADLGPLFWERWLVRSAPDLAE